MESQVGSLRRPPLNHRANWGFTYLLAVTLVGEPDPAEVTGTMSGTRVVIADDDVLLREGLASLLERASFEVIGQAGTGTELLGLVRRHLPDLAIVDIRMPPTYSTEGLEAAQAIRQELPETAILVEEAGGTFTDFEGAPTIYAPTAFATHGRLHAEALARFRGDTP